jgi:hypothetical protein
MEKNPAVKISRLKNSKGGNKNMSIEKKSLISNMTATKKALIASNTTTSSPLVSSKTAMKFRNPIVAAKTAHKAEMLTSRTAMKYTNIRAGKVTVAEIHAAKAKL